MEIQLSGPMQHSWELELEGQLGQQRHAAAAAAVAPHSAGTAELEERGRQLGTLAEAMAQQEGEV